MNVTRISLKQTGRFNRLILDLAEGDEKLRSFYSIEHSVEHYESAIKRRAIQPVDRELLSNALIAQYVSIGGAENGVLKNIESLRSEKTFTVTTGHQLNIFTGPLYFVYKILHTIKLAETLREAYPNHHFVPVYWMNTEDHDLAEVGQFNLFGRKYEWMTDQTGATGRMSPNGLSEFCNQLKDVFSNNEETLKLVEMFRKAYSEFANLATATRFFANELFGSYGLVIIDGDDASLKRSFQAFFKKDLIENIPFEAVKETNSLLENAGYHVQVNPRQINCFYLADGIRGRIIATEECFKVFQTDIRFTEPELLNELELHPESFSPNVVLRPVFQEFILPNLTYVGGAGELSYWLQYKEYFNRMGVHFPMLCIRNHFLWMDRGMAQRLEQLQVLPQDLFHSIDDLINAHVLANADANVSLDEQKELVSKAYQQLADTALQLDASLVDAIEAERIRVIKGIEQWEGRFTRSLKKEQEVTVNRIRKAEQKLFPNGFLQERHDNFLELYARSGVHLFEEMLSAIEPFRTEFGMVVSNH